MSSLFAVPQPVRRRCGQLCISVCLAGPGLLWAQTPETETAAAVTEDAEPAPSSLAWAAGLGWWRYSEPVMRLEGPELTVEVQRPLETEGSPVFVHAQLGMGLMQYTSTDSGRLSGVPMLRGQAGALWQLGHSSPWRGGLQLEATWTDLRGTSSAGYAGYERLNTKAWALVQYTSTGQHQAELGLLLRGWQTSALSQANPTLPDIRNTQTRGFFMGYQHPSLGWPSNGRYRLRPWIRLTSVASSDMVGAAGWYEPRNRTLQIGLQSHW